PKQRVNGKAETEGNQRCSKSVTANRDSPDQKYRVQTNEWRKQQRNSLEYACVPPRHDQQSDADDAAERPQCSIACAEQISEPTLNYVASPWPFSRLSSQSFSSALARQPRLLGRFRPTNRP